MTQYMVEFMVVTVGRRLVRKYSLRNIHHHAEAIHVRKNTRERDEFAVTWDFGGD